MSKNSYLMPYGNGLNQSAMLHAPNVRFTLDAALEIQSVRPNLCALFDSVIPVLDHFFTLRILHINLWNESIMLRTGSHAILHCGSYDKRTQLLLMWKNLFRSESVFSMIFLIVQHILNPAATRSKWKADNFENIFFVQLRDLLWPFSLMQAALVIVHLRKSLESTFTADTKAPWLRLLNIRYHAGIYPSFCERSVEPLRWYDVLTMTRVHVRSVEVESSSCMTGSQCTIAMLACLTNASQLQSSCFTSLGRLCSDERVVALLHWSSKKVPYCGWCCVGTSLSCRDRYFRLQA